MSVVQHSHEQGRGRKLERGMTPQGRSVSLECPSSTLETPGGLVSTDVFIISRLGDTTSYFFSWFCKKYRIRIGARDLGAKEETRSRCPICLDACTNSTIELRCGHSFCRSCLTRSAANNMTSCALCRREQEINPELLRARFDEQRMLNLAQRLAIPPPLRSRPGASAASMTAAVGEREEKDALRAGFTPTLAREMLFGPWGDVGAMSADDLRRRWKFGSAQTSTVGASSASEILCSWRELTQCMYMQRDGDSMYSRADSMSCCSGDAGTAVLPHEVDESARRSSTASPSSGSPVAGGSSPADLSSRWRNLTKIPPSGSTMAEGTSTDDVLGNSGSLDSACLSKRWLEASGLDAAGHLEVGELSERLNNAIGSKGSGDFSAACLRKSWQEASGLDSSIGHLNVCELSERLNQAIGSQGVGAITGANLEKRWNADMRDGHADNSIFVFQQADGVESTTALRSSWCRASHGSAPVG